MVSINRDFRYPRYQWSQLARIIEVLLYKALILKTDVRLMSSLGTIFHLSLNSIIIDFLIICLKLILIPIYILTNFYKTLRIVKMHEKAFYVIHVSFPLRVRIPQKDPHGGHTTYSPRSHKQIIGLQPTTNKSRNFFRTVFLKLKEYCGRIRNY